MAVGVEFTDLVLGEDGPQACIDGDVGTGKQAAVAAGGDGSDDLVVVAEEAGDVFEVLGGAEAAEDEVRRSIERAKGTSYEHKKVDLH